ncbi:MAG: RHS repeat-associated core domain-containing protein [Coriobacteriales bacterium]|jgi:RHS repeat-associated protein|nr:RHS repeat-associated core domain-containing protein [Coriobacteriales bacterium]
MANTIRAANPFRYRGYYYDTETGLYYLNTRYYDPSVGRFLNLDSQLNLLEGTTGYNLFQYCGNNPVMFRDIEGCSYENSKPVDRGEGVYEISTVVTTEKGSITLVYFVDNGYIRFSFDDNDYETVLAYGGELDLAMAILEAARSHISDYLYGRTIGESIRKCNLISDYTGYFERVLIYIV